MDRTRIAVAVAAVIVVVGAVLLLTGGGDDDDAGDDGITPAETVAADDNAYTPATFTVVEGEHVRFVNDDDIAHTFTADDGLFDSGPVDPDGEFLYAFDGPVTVDFHCEIHPSMTGTVEVTAGS